MTTSSSLNNSPNCLVRYQPVRPCHLLPTAILLDQLRSHGILQRDVLVVVSRNSSPSIILARQTPVSSMSLIYWRPAVQLRSNIPSHHPAGIRSQLITM